MALNKIAIGGISTECSSYSPLHQNKDDFSCIRGQDLLDLVSFPFLEHGITPLPLFFNKSVPGGPIEKQYFDVPMRIGNYFFPETKDILDYVTYFPDYLKQPNKLFCQYHQQYKRS